MGICIACGSGSKGYKYSGSNKIDKVAWFRWNSGYKTHESGTKKPNELGLYDMTGNVEEWTSDNYSFDYKNPRNSSLIVSRGGSFLSIERISRVAFRSSYEKTYSGEEVGLRLAF